MCVCVYDRELVMVTTRYISKLAWIHYSGCTRCWLWNHTHSVIGSFCKSHTTLYTSRSCPSARTNVLSMHSVPNQEQASWNQQGTIPYQIPPKEMVQLVDMQIDHSVSFPPGYPKEYMLIIDSPPLPSIEQLARPELRLAGYRIHPPTFTPSRISFVSNIQVWNCQLHCCIMDISESLKRHSKSSFCSTSINHEPRLCNIQWAPDGRKFTFCVFEPNFGLQLWLCDIDNHQIYSLLEENQRLHAICCNPVKWFHDSRRLLIQLVSNQIPFPDIPNNSCSSVVVVPRGPLVQYHWEQREAPARTFPDVLKNSYDESCLEYYCTSELAIYDIVEKRWNSFLKPSCFTATSISPNGEYILIQEMTRPYSYQLPASRFPRKIQIFHIQDASTTMIAHLGLQEYIPIDMDAVVDGPRSFQWRANVDATLCWVKALDQGNPKNQVEYRDAVYALSAPFRDNPVLLFKLKWRFQDIDWSDNEYALVWEEWYQSRSRRVYSCHIPLQLPSTGANESAADSILESCNCIHVDLKCLWDIPNWEDRYHLPGYPISRMNRFGKWTLRNVITGNKDTNPLLYITGPGASEEGDRPYLDIMDNKGTRRRLWQSSPPYYERLIGVYSEDDQQQITQILISRESPKQLPNIYRIDLCEMVQKKKTDHKESFKITWNDSYPAIQQWTFFQHPFPEFLHKFKESW